MPSGSSRRLPLNSDLWVLVHVVDEAAPEGVWSNDVVRFQQQNVLRQGRSRRFERRSNSGVVAAGEAEG